MRSFLFTGSSYLKHRWHAIGAYDIHSPFVYALFQDAIRPKLRSVLPAIEKERRRLIRSRTQISYKDFKTGERKQVRLSYIARTSPSRRSFSAFLLRLSNFLQVERIVESGSSVGINALYLSQAEQLQQLVTIEGNDAVAEVARDLLSRTDKAVVKSGDLYELFPKIVSEARPELVFLDADHRSSAIEFYLQNLMCLDEAPVCIVIHDIYWSRDMAGKWQEIIKDNRFPLTIDLFQTGLVFPRAVMEKQHFRLKF